MSARRHRLVSQPQTALCMLLIATITAGCGGTQKYLKTKSGPLLEYTRTPCFGPCPAYKLEVQADGQARYVGRSNVTNIGEYSGQWTPAQLREVATVAGEVQLSRKAGNYDNPLIMDLPATRLTLGKYRVLDRVNGPDLDQLYGTLDSLIGITVWSKVSATNAPKKR